MRGYLRTKLVRQPSEAVENVEIIGSDGLGRPSYNIRNRVLKQILAFLACCLFATPLEAAPNGRGAGRGVGKKAVENLKSRWRGRGRPTFNPNRPPYKGYSPYDNRFKPKGFSGRDRAFQIQQFNEERKLRHRLDTAQRLREIANRNGNTNLLDAADRMEHKALEHYDKRLNKIGDTSGFAEELGQGGFELQQAPAGVGQPGISDVPSQTPANVGQPKLSDVPSQAGRPDAFERQLLNEDRKFEQRLDKAQKLRDLAAQNGNQRLLQKANRMEQEALQLYEKRLDKIGQLKKPIVESGN